LKDRRYRLKQMLPGPLDAKILCAGRGTYKLDLGPNEVCLLHYAEDERLAEVPADNGFPRGR